MIGDDIDAMLREAAVPVGHRYTLVIVSVLKRMLSGTIPASFQIRFLDALENMTRSEWLSEDMVRAVQPMCDQGYEIVQEVRKLGPRKCLDVYAEVFATFAKLNPSLIEVLALSPQYQFLQKRNASC